MEMGFLDAELLQDLAPVSSIGALRLEASPIFRAAAAAALGHGTKAYVVKGETRLFAYAVYVWGEDISNELAAL